MYRYETHLHTVEGSACGFTPGAEYPAIYKERGYDGIFITDHFFHGNTRPSRELPWREYVDAYMKGYEESKKAGDPSGTSHHTPLDQGRDDKVGTRGRWRGNAGASLQGP